MFWVKKRLTFIKKWQVFNELRCVKMNLEIRKIKINKMDINSVDFVDCSKLNSLLYLIS